MDVKERYNPIVIGVNGTVQSSSANVGGFLALTSGTLTLTRVGSTPTVLVNGIAVTAGIWTPMPFYVGVNGCTVTLAGGASGTLGV